mmetsp:Transcript_43294/g.97710  ORF Transcript_43294/g.97710 Transcript_43294/m.97710 type:complete len:427 (+) Transcript_43294:11-1291(+)
MSSEDTAPPPPTRQSAAARRESKEHDRTAAMSNHTRLLSPVDLPLVDGHEPLTVEVTTMVAADRVVGVGHAAEDHEGLAGRPPIAVAEQIYRLHAARRDLAEGLCEVSRCELRRDVAEAHLVAHGFLHALRRRQGHGRGRALRRQVSRLRGMRVVRLRVSWRRAARPLRWRPRGTMRRRWPMAIGPALCMRRPVSFRWPLPRPWRWRPPTIGVAMRRWWSMLPAWRWRPPGSTRPVFVRGRGIAPRRHTRMPIVVGRRRVHVAAWVRVPGHRRPAIRRRWPARVIRRWPVAIHLPGRRAPTRRRRTPRPIGPGRWRPPVVRIEAPRRQHPSVVRRRAVARRRAPRRRPPRPRRWPPWTWRRWPPGLMWLIWLPLCSPLPPALTAALAATASLPPFRPLVATVPGALLLLNEVLQAQVQLPLDILDG